MRKLLKLTVPSLGIAVLALGVLAPSATAGGGEGPGAAPLTIVKTVSGPVPAGTTFTVSVQCTPDEEPSDAGAAMIDGGNSATVTFDAAGQPTSPDVITFDGPGVCTVTETATGGAATTTYACEGSVPEEPDVPEEVLPEADGGFSAQQVEPTPVCATTGPGPITVNIFAEDQEATVTVNNTFATPTPAAQIQARPLFTG